MRPLCPSLSSVYSSIASLPEQRMPIYCWHRFISLTLQLAAVTLHASINAVPADASPLLEEEQRTLFLGLCLYRQHPRFFHRSCVDCMLSANDYPIYIRQIEVAQILHQRLTRQEPYRSRQLRRLSDSCFTSLASTDTPSHTLAGIVLC